MDLHNITGSKNQVEVLYPQDEEFETLIEFMRQVMGLYKFSKTINPFGEITAVVQVKGSPEDDDLHGYILQKDDWITHITPIMCRLTDQPILVIGGKEYDC